MGLQMPSPQAMNRISMLFAKLQEADLPFEKLKFLQAAMDVILENTVDPECTSNDVKHFGCDEFLPLLSYIVCKCGFHFAEIEAEYIFGLMTQANMSGDGGYYATLLCSAAVSMKDFKALYEKTEGNAVVSKELLICDSDPPINNFNFQNVTFGF